jgi:hypothetical protein
VAGPWEKYGQSPQASSVYGLPRAPTPQTPAQQQGDQLGVVRTQQQIQAQPLQNENTRVNIQQGQASVQNQQQQIQFNRGTTAAQLYDKFTSDPTVKAYREVIPQVAQAMGSKPGGANDISVVYAWAKAMDPTGSVRDQDVKLGQSATSPLQQAQFMVSQYRLQGGGQLPPEVKTGLIEAMRDKARMLDRQYSEVRSNFLKQAQTTGIPTDIFGPHEGSLYQPIEEQYIRQHGGTPKINGVPIGTPQSQGQGDIGFNTPNQSSHAYSSEQAAAYDNFIRTHPHVTPEQLDAFLSSIHMQIGNSAAVANAVNKGGVFDPTQSSAAGVMDPRSQAAANQMMQQNGGMGSAGVAGFGDAASLGSMDELGAAAQALGQSLSGQGSFGENYGINADANRAYLGQLQQQNPVPYLAGQVVGGAMLPAGEVSGATDLAKLGAAYGGVYGFNSGSGSLVDRAAGGVGGAAVGAAVPAVLSKVFKPKVAEGIDPLVDPVTGELNQPMDSMNPAQRSAMMKDYGLKTQTPGMVGGRSARVVEQGFNNLPGSAGHMEDVNAAASGELRRSMQGVAQQFGSSKTLNEGGAAVQSAALARNERATGVIGKAYDAIPISPQAQASTSSTVRTLQSLTGRFQSNEKLAALTEDKQIKGYLDALQSGPVSWQDIKDFRSLVGEKIGDMRFGEKSRVSDLRALYAGLSEDMRATASAQGPGALRAFERANNLNRQNEQLIQKSLTQILGKDGQMKPESAAAAIQAMTKGGKAGGDLRTLAQIRSATVKSGAWDEIASTLIHLGGQPANSEGRAFSPQTFVQWYADMSEPARRMLFKPELRNSLDGFVAMNQQLSRIKGLSNTSNTTPTMIGSGLVAAGGVAAVTHPMALLGLVGGGVANFVMAKAWTSPQFVRLVTGLGRASITGNENAVRSQVGRLSKFAATNPEFSEPVQSILRQIANDNAPRLGSAVASPDERPDQQKQPQR